MSLQQAITEFRAQFRGTVLEPGDAQYAEARKVYNAMIDRKPRLIAKCTDVADVMAAVRMANANSLPVSIRGVGHNAAIGSAGSPQTGRRTGCSDRENPLVMSISRTLNRH